MKAARPASPVVFLGGQLIWIPRQRQACFGGMGTHPTWKNAVMRFKFLKMYALTDIQDI